MGLVQKDCVQVVGVDFLRRCKILILIDVKDVALPVMMDALSVIVFNHLAGDERKNGPECRIDMLAEAVGKIRVDDEICNNRSSLRERFPDLLEKILRDEMLGDIYASEIGVQNDQVIVVFVLDQEGARGRGVKMLVRPELFL